MGKKEKKEKEEKEEKEDAKTPLKSPKSGGPSLSDFADVRSSALPLNVGLTLSLAPRTRTSTRRATCCKGPQPSWKMWTGAARMWCFC
jgi:hypothetical protein